ncbi:MAG: primosomal protein N' [Bacteroidaceae bacterium]|nr:primosomal protein N' [Bacteroidaceae bacterium]
MTEQYTFADVLLPLALQEVLTYRVPATFQLVVGQRVIVPLGKSKRYSGFVVRLHNEAPSAEFTIKEVEGVVDTTPLLRPEQIEFWHWIAQYYMCTKGEVMKAALPSGLKLESETRIVKSLEIPEEDMPARFEVALRKLDTEKPISIDELQKQGISLHTIRQIIEKGYAEVAEHMNESFKPRTETYVRLNPEYLGDAPLNALFETLKRSPKQDALLLAYLDLSKSATAIALQNPKLLAEVSKKQLLTRTGSSDAVLKGLLDKNILQRYSVEIGRLKENGVVTQLGVRPLSENQQKAFDEILKQFETHQTVLLHGVTSSGKTEVYTQLISHTLAQGKQVLYLLPEIALTTQITTRLGRVFGDKMGVYHSKFPDAERVEVWRKQMSDQPYPLILGVRSSLFLPFQNLGLIIVDEEHETSYKQQDPAPRYHARDAAIVLAKKVGAKILLGTATPSLETYTHARSGRYGLVEMLVRYGGVNMPRVEVADVKELRRKKLMKTPFSPLLLDRISDALTRGEQTILFINRRGYSPVMDCHTCGWTPRCTCCDVSLTYHQRDRRLVCHYCGKSFDMPKQCPNCGSTELRDIGYGTEKIEESIQQLFPMAKTERMDLDTTRSRTAYERIIQKFQQGETNILIGTQMLTKGLDFDKVSVVGIVNADHIMNLPDFRAYERAFQMLSQVAGRAGRRGTQGSVVLQTRQVDNPLIAHIQDNDYARMYEEQIVERQMFRYPPYYRIINIYLKHREDATVEAASRYLASLLAPHFSDCLLGPERPYVSRVQLLYIRKFLLKVSPQLPVMGVRQTLLAARAALVAQEPFKRVQIYFDVDPL